MGRESVGVGCIVQKGDPMNRTKIPWCDWTWNPFVGCSPASEGCAHCYAQSMAKRFGWAWGTPTFFPDRLEEPFRARKPGRIFVCSVSDLFHPHNDFDDIDKVFEIMAADKRHTFIVLTKRPEAALQFFKTPRRWFAGSATANGIACEAWDTWPLPNVWFGVTVENQARAEQRIPLLFQIPAAVRFVSVEPMLGPLNLTRVKFPTGATENTLDGRANLNPDYADLIGKLNAVDWVIAGPETGPGARKCEPAWIDALEQQAPCFFDKRQEWVRREFPDGKDDPTSPRRCRVCGCTDLDCSGCIARTGHPCQTD